MDMLTVGGGMIGAWLFYSMLRFAKRCGIEEGERMAREEIRKKQEDVLRQLEAQLAAQIKNVAALRKRGLRACPLLGKGQFSKVWKVESSVN